MPSAATLRHQIELALQSRFPAALTPSPRAVREVAATGIPQIDCLLEGGFPVGAISEIAGPASSGRTSLALAFLARRTGEERVCAWIDTDDTLDPESAAANGVSLKQLLWVRCRDQLNVRSSGAVPLAKKKNWSRLDQALRATDLLLQAGGFASIVLDLGNTQPEYGSRIPLATWFRFRQAADRTRCSLLVLGKAPYAQSSAALALDCSPLRPQTAGGTVLCGFTYNVQRGRQRFAPSVISTRKPPVSTWSSISAWEMEKRA